MKHNKNFHTIPWRIAYAVASFILLPVITFFCYGTIALILVNSTIINSWFNGKSHYLNDLISFYQSKNITVLYVVVAMVLSSIILFVVLNINWKFLKNKTLSKKDPKIETANNWLYNAKDNIGNYRAFKKEFNDDPDEANFVLGKVGNDYLVNKVDSHAMVIATSGGGKTQKVVLPNIDRNAKIKNKPNFVIIDPKGEILYNTGYILAKNNYVIKVFDFEDAKLSVKWNPLKVVWDVFHKKEKDKLTGEDYSIGFNKIREIIDSLNWTSNKDTIWVNSAKNVLVTILKFMILYSLENESFTLNHFNLSNCNWFLNVKNFKEGAWVDITASNKNINQYWFKLHSEVLALTEVVKETLSGFLANALNAVMQFSNDLLIEKITSNNNFEIQKLLSDKERPVAIFIKFPEDKENALFLISLLISQIYSGASDLARQNANNKLERKLFFLLEEFYSLPKINSLAQWISISRSKGIFFMFVVQDFNQLAKYNSGFREEKILENQAELLYFISCADLQTLESLSKKLGNKTIIRQSTTNRDNTKDSTTFSQMDVPLMSVADLKEKSSDYVLLSLRNQKPVIIKPKMAYTYFENKKFVPKNDSEESFGDKKWDFDQMVEIDFDRKDSEVLDEAKIEIETETGGEKNNEESNDAKNYIAYIAQINKLKRNYCLNGGFKESKVDDRTDENVEPDKERVKNLNEK